MIFDTHAHYDDNRFDDDRSQVLSILEEEGIKVMNASASLESLQVVLEMTKNYKNVYGALGVHPSECREMREEHIDFMRKHLRDDKIVAVGEIGLDYHYDDDVPKDIQKKWFITQLNLAKEMNMPVNIHSRDAAKDTFDILSKEEYKGLTGIIHCFSNSMEMAKEYVKLGYYIGIGGVVTFKNAKEIKEVVKTIPLDKLVIETDCPYLAPTPYRGRRNSSVFLTYVIEEIAAIKEIDARTVEKVTFENAMKVYNIGEI